MAFSPGANLGSASGEIRIDTAAAERNVRQLQGTVGTFASTSDSAFRRIATGVGLLTASGAIASIFTGGVSAAADFEAQVSAIGAVASATGTELDQLRQLALDLGKETVFSASQAAQAIEELAKAGVPVADILNGAADGATALAAAAGVSLPNAAIVMANAINVFGIEADQAVRVADTFAAAANKSAANVEELAISLSQSGLVADQFGLSIEDTVGALSLFADQGLKGSDAGTSLRTALLRMLTPIGEGANKIEELGLNFRDANGEFIGLAGAAEELRAKLSLLSPAQRDAALTAIFGQDAIRVGAILYSEGGEAVREYTAAVSETGAAQKAAEQRLNNFNGALERLRGSIETASIIIGSALLPALKEVVQVVTSVVNAFIDLPAPIQAVLGGLVAASGALAGIAGIMVLAGPRLGAFKEALIDIRKALLGFVVAHPVILAVVAALALFGLAYKTNFGGFADAVNGAINTVREFGNIFRRAFIQAEDLTSFGNAGAAFVALGTAMKQVLGIDVIDEFIRIGKAANRIGINLTRMGRNFRKLSQIIKTGGLAEGLDALFGKVGRDLLAEFGDAVGALPRAFGTAIAQIRTGIEPLDRILINSGKGVNLLGRAFEEVFAGNIDRAIGRSRAALLRFDRALNVLATVAIAGLRAAISTITDVAVAIGSWIITEGPSLIDAVQAFVVDDLWPRVKEEVSDIGDAVVRIASWSVQVGAGILDAVAEALPCWASAVS
jgi:TP901 family phage tail tape measure protein